MPDNRSLNPYKKFYPAPEIQSYKIISDKCFRGFRNEIVWTHSDKSTRIFRIYRAKIGAVATKKKYTIDNLALQRLTQLKSYDLPNKTLYDKSLFVQNSKVSFAQSDTTRHDQVGSDPTTFVYKEVGYVRANKTKSFKFIDRDVKFGQTYSYVITGLNNFLRESQKSQPLIVTTELVEMTPLLTYLSGCTIPEGILLRMGSDKGDQVRGFEVFRLDEETKRFEKIFFVEKMENSNFANFIDSPEVVGKVYKYRVYAVDLLGGRSLSGLETEVLFDPILKSKGRLQTPRVTVVREENETIIKAWNNNDALGARIERRDVWNFEQSFELKTSKNRPWSNVHLFNEKEFIEMIDTTADEGRLYEYRVTLIHKTGLNGTAYVTPALYAKSGLAFSNFDSKEENPKLTSKLKFFNVSVDDVKRRPILAKFNWGVSGDWSHILIKGAGEVLQIDSIYNEALYNKFEPDTTYRLEVELYDQEGGLLDTKKGILVST